MQGMKSHDEFVDKYMTDFYLFVHAGLEKKLQPLSDKFAMLKVGKSEDDRIEYFEEIYKYFDRGISRQTISSAYKVNARIRKRMFKNGVYVWELKFNSVTEVSNLDDITQEVWNKEMAFYEKLRITPEIVECIEAIKNKLFDEQNPNANVIRDERDAEGSGHFIQTMLGKSRTFKTKLTVSDVDRNKRASVLMSGNISSIGTENDISGAKGSKDNLDTKKEVKLQNKIEPAEIPQEKKAGLGGFKLFGKALGKGGPAAPDAEKEKEKEKSTKPSFASKLGQNLMKKKTTLNENQADHNDTSMHKTSGDDGTRNLLKDKMKAFSQRQNLNKDNKRDQLDLLAKELRRFLSL